MHFFASFKSDFIGLFWLSYTCTRLLKSYNLWLDGLREQPTDYHPYKVNLSRQSPNLMNFKVSQTRKEIVWGLGLTVWLQSLPGKKANH